MHETTQGIYDALLRGRFAFDFVHEDRLDPERLSKYRALLLPNIAMLSDRQCQQIRDYVQSGGSIMASFETGLYDENLNPRADFGLADLLGIHKAGDVVGTNGNAYYGAHRTPSITVLEGFTDTNWIPGAQNRVPLKARAESGADRRPRIRAVSAGAGLPAGPHTDEPAVVSARNRLQPHRLFSWRYRAQLLAHRPRRSVAAAAQHDRWITRDERIVHVEGEGFIEMFAWETTPGYAVHLLNYTNPNAHHGWMQSIYPLGPQTVRMKLAGRGQRKVGRTAPGSHSVPFTLQGAAALHHTPR